MTFLPTLFLGVLAFAAAAVLGGTPARAATLTYAISVENYIDSYNYNNNYNMFAGSGSSMKLVVNGSNSGAKSNTVTRGLIQLPAAATGIPAAEVVDAAIYLDLTQDTGANPYDTAEGVTLYPLTQTFNPNTATWTYSDSSSTSTAWAGGTYESTGVYWNPGPSSGSALQNASKTAPVLCSWDVTSLWGDPNLLDNGAILKFNEPAATADLSSQTTYQTVLFWGGSASSSYPAVVQGYVVVETVPEPSTVALLLAGASLAAIGFGRRCWAGRRRPALAGPME
jgi:hypothetical protein